MSFPRACLPLLLAGLLPAQRTVIVDASGGGGATYTTIADAFANLQEGDIIHVRAGNYDGASVSTVHSFALIGEGSPVIRPVAGSGSTLSITLSSNLQRVTIKNLTIFSELTGQWALRVGSYFSFFPAPTVHVEDCTIQSQSSYNDQVGLLAFSIGLTLQRCTADTVQISDGVASILDSTLRGHDAQVVNLSSQRPLGPLDVLNSEVWIVDSTLLAGSSMGLYVSPASALGFGGQYGHTTSHVYLCGTTSLIADQAPNANWGPPPVVINYVSWLPTPPTLDYESTVSFVSSPLGPTFGTAILTNLRTIPNLRTDAAAPGTNLDCHVHGSAGDTAAALIGFAVFPQRVLGSPVFVQLIGLLTAGAGVIPGGGESVFAVPVPNLPEMQGLCVESIGLTLDAFGVITLTNPASTTIF